MSEGKRGVWRQTGLFLLLAAVMGALQWNWFAMPLERDEGEYAYSAWLMRTGKGVPYKDSFLQKPPMIIYTYALMEALAPGNNKVGFRVAGFWAALATAGLVWRLGTREFGGRAGLWAAWLWVVFLHQFMMFRTVAANVEKFMVVPMLGAMAVAGRGERRGWRWGLAGALGAVAVLYKPICAPVLGVWCAWAMFSGQRRGGGPPAPPGASAGSRTPQGRTSVWRRVGWLALGGAVATAAGVAWFAWKGALGAMWECAVEFTGAYARMAGNPLSTGWFWFKVYGGWKVAVILVLAAGGVVLRRRDGGLGWGAVFAAAWGVALGDMVGGHYYIMALPMAAVLGGAFIERVSQKDGRGVWRGAIATAGVFAVLMSGEECKALRHAPARLVRGIYGSQPFVEAEEAGLAVAEKCPEEGTVHIIGSEPEVLWYARRKCATRFDIAYPMTLPTRFAAKYQDEAARALEERRPDVVVFVRAAGGFGGREVMAQPPFGWYLGRMASVVFGADYELALAHMPGEDGGWKRGGTWEGRTEEEADWGIWKARGSAPDS